MLQKDKPSDYVIATGEAHSVGEFIELAFGHAGLNWKNYVKIDKTFYRPAEVHTLIGDYTKARKELKWKPSINFPNLVKMMIDADIKRLKNNEP